MFQMETKPKNFDKVKKRYQENPAFRNYLVEEQKPRLTPRFLVQREEPWHRLYMNRTLSSYYKTVYFYDPRIPVDKLDVQLDGTYDHYAQFNASPADVVRCDRDHLCNYRLFQKPEPLKTAATQPYEGHVLNISTHPKRCLIQSAKLAIERSHLVQSNPGYARKPRMGGIYMY